MVVDMEARSDCFARSYWPQRYVAIVNTLRLLYRTQAGRVWVG